MKTPLLELLKITGPCPSSQLVEELVAGYGLTKVAARQQISRAVRAGGILSLDKVLPKSERFIYLRNQYGSEEYWSNLAESLQASGSAYGLALGATIARGGIMPVGHFPGASGSPVAMKGRLSHSSVLESLRRMRLVEITEVGGIGSCVALPQKQDFRYQEAAVRIKARLITESVLMKAIAQWVRNLSIISYDSLRTRDQCEGGVIPSVSNFNFDMSAPSYLSPLVQYTKSGEKRPGFFACDVLLDGELDTLHIKPFITKCRSILSLKNSGRCLFIFVADKYSKEAFQELKKYGIIPATPENLFGKELAEGLQRLNEFLRHLAFNAGGFLEALDEIMTKLGHIEGATSQLQGDLFEYLVAEVARINSSNVELGKLCTDGKGRKADCDVLVKNGKAEVTFIECKGYKPFSQVREEDVKNWVEKQVPVFFDYAKNETPNISIKMELWTTGKFSEQSIASLNKFSENNKLRNRYSINVLDAYAVRERFSSTNDPSVLRVFEKHFIERGVPKQRIESRGRPHSITGGSVISNTDDFDS